MKERNARGSLQVNKLTESVNAASNIATSGVETSENREKSTVIGESAEQVSDVTVISESEALLKTVGNVRLYRRTRSTLVALLIQNSKRRGRHIKKVRGKTRITVNRKTKEPDDVTNDSIKHSKSDASASKGSAMVTRSKNERLKIKLIKSSASQFVCVLAGMEPTVNEIRKVLSEKVLDKDHQEQNTSVICHKAINLSCDVEVRSVSEPVVLKQELVYQDEPLDYSLKALTKHSVDIRPESSAIIGCIVAGDDLIPSSSNNLSVNLSKKVSCDKSPKYLSKNSTKKLQEVSSIDLIKNFLKNSSKTTLSKSSKKPVKNSSNETLKNSTMNSLKTSTKNLSRNSTSNSSEKSTSNSSKNSALNATTKLSKNGLLNQPSKNVTSFKTKLPGSTHSSKKLLEMLSSSVCELNVNNKRGLKAKSDSNSSLSGRKVKQNQRSRKSADLSQEIPPEVYIDREYCEKDMSVTHNIQDNSIVGCSSQTETTYIEVGYTDDTVGTVIGTVGLVDQPVVSTPRESVVLDNQQLWQSLPDMKHDIQDNLGYSSLRALAADFLRAQ